MQKMNGNGELRISYEENKVATDYKLYFIFVTTLYKKVYLTKIIILFNLIY